MDVGDVRGSCEKVDEERRVFVEEAMRGTDHVLVGQ